MHGNGPGTGLYADPNWMTAWMTNSNSSTLPLKSHVPWQGTLELPKQRDFWSGGEGMGQGNPSAWSLWCIWAYLGVGGDTPAKQLCFTNCGQSNLEISNVGMAMVRHSRDVMPNIYPLVTDVLVAGFKFFFVTSNIVHMVGQWTVLCLSSILYIISIIS